MFYLLLLYFHFNKGFKKVLCVLFLGFYALPQQLKLLSKRVSLTFPMQTKGTMMMIKYEKDISRIFNIK